MFLTLNRNPEETWMTRMNEISMFSILKSFFLYKGDLLIMKFNPLLRQKNDESLLILVQIYKGLNKGFLDITTTVLIFLHLSESPVSSVMCIHHISKSI